MTRTPLLDNLSIRTTRPRHMESCPFHGHAKSTTMSTSMSTDPFTSTTITIATRKPPHYEPAHLILRCDLRHRHQQFCWSLVWNWFDSQFSIWLDSIVVLIWLDSIIIFRFDFTHVYHIYFRPKSHNSNHTPVRLQGVLHWPGCLWNIPTLKWWNIPQLW